MDAYSFGFIPLKLKFARKSVGNQRIFLPIFLWILALWTKIKIFVHTGTNLQHKKI
jgi:hypothetical protein